MGNNSDNLTGGKAMECSRLCEIAFDKYLGGQVSFKGLLASVDKAKTKNGDDYGNIVMTDKDMKVNAKYFNCGTTGLDNLEVGKVYEVVVSVKSYKGAASVIIESMEALNEASDTYLDTDTRCQNAWIIITKRLSELEGYVLYPLVLNLLNANFKDFVKWGGGSSNHHAAMGGLMVHSAGVCEASVSLAEAYNKMYGDGFVNIDLIKCGALLHDIGKLKEMELNKATGRSEYTTLSALASHSILGIKMVTEEASRLGLSDSDPVMELIHIIASHHLSVESGALMNPHSIEAYIVAYADGLDACADRFRTAFKEIKPGETQTLWKSGGIEILYRTSVQSGRPTL